MVFKINISEKSGKTFKVESDSEALVGKELHEKISGNDINTDLEGYEFEVTGMSDKSGFTALKEVEGIGMKRVLLNYEKGMRKRPKKEGKRKRSKNMPKGLRLRKTVRGKVISPDIVQINLKLLKEGSKKLAEIFPEQNKSPKPEVKEEAKPVETPKSEVKEKTNATSDTTKDDKNNNAKTDDKDAEQKNGDVKVKEKSEPQGEAKENRSKASKENPAEKPKEKKKEN